MLVRNAHVAGSFYDGNSQTLAQYVQQSLAQATQQKSAPPAQSIHMVLLPHAGHFFCGHVIAQTLAAVRMPQKLILLGPNHTGRGTAPTGLAVWAKGQWQNPLGHVPIDEALAAEIIHSGAGFEHDTAAHEQEHSLEVLLPFLQAVAPSYTMVPICVGTGNMQQLKQAGLTLASIIHEHQKQGEDIALVVSSDMHHFSSHEKTLELDNVALEALMELDPEKLYNKVKQLQISMCGVYPAIMAMYTCKTLGAKKCNLVSHTTSYEKSMQSERTVGYAGLFVPKNTC